MGQICSNTDAGCSAFGLVGKAYWAISFFIHTGVWKANSLGCARGIFQGSQGLKLSFLGGARTSVSEGSYRLGQSG